MNNNELRIGNYVTDSKTGKVVTVDGIQFTGRVVTHDESYDDWKRGIESVGIPLTPEILDKAGFDGSNRCFSFGAHDYLFRFEGERFYYGYWSEDGFVSESPEIKYVHQLQNLIFALCGEELEINL